MCANQVKKDEFGRLLKLKDRSYSITEHAEMRAKKRFLLIDSFKRDIESATPSLIFEQEHEGEEERKFDVYYRQTDDYYHRYIAVLNDCIRLISLMRVSKDVQRKMMGKQVY